MLCLQLPFLAISELVATATATTTTIAKDVLQRIVIVNLAVTVNLDTALLNIIQERLAPRLAILEMRVSVQS